MRVQVSQNAPFKTMRWRAKEEERVLSDTSDPISQSALAFEATWDFGPPHPHTNLPNPILVDKKRGKGYHRNFLWRPPGRLIQNIIAKRTVPSIFRLSIIFASFPLIGLTTIYKHPPVQRSRNDGDGEFPAISPPENDVQLASNSFLIS
ncbi:hypothetical protein YC2023_016506 [Brassica napus]